MDDERSVRRVVERVLVKGGYRVLATECGEDSVSRYGLSAVAHDLLQKPYVAQDLPEKIREVLER